MTTSTDEARIAARYPRRSLVDVAFAIAAALALLGAIALVAYSGLVRSNPAVSAMVTRFEVQSPTLTRAEIRVQRPDPSKLSRCYLFAQATSFEHVGELSVDIPPNSAKLTTVSVDIKTIKEATSVSVDRCELVIN